MKNCKTEFLEQTKDKDILCSIIERDGFEANHLCIGYSLEDFANFLDKINYEYDNGFGSKEVYGAIWYTDGTWSVRGEYDGLKWWEHKVCPEIPKELTQQEQEQTP